MSSFRTHPEAAEELDDQLAYLKARTLWAASKFADAFEAALTKIHSHPASGHFVWRQFRRYNIPGQSHAVIYREEADSIYVIAVMHEERHPDYWKERIDEDIPAN